MAPMAYAQALLVTCAPQRCHPDPTVAPWRARLRRRPRRLIRCPARPRNAGSSVIEATTMISTMTEMAIAGGGHERDAGDGQAEHRDDHRAAGEDHGLAGGGDGAAGRLLDGHPAGEVLAVPDDDEQGVVDAYPDADHGAKRRRPGGDVDQVGDERHRADAEGEAEDGHPDGEAHGDERAERQEQDDDGGDQPDQLADARRGLLEREEQVAAHLDPQRRARSGPGAELLEVLQVVLVQVLEHRVLDTDEGDPTVGRDRAARRRCLGSGGRRPRRVGGVEHLGQVGHRRLDLGQGGPRVRGVEEAGPLVARRQDHLCGESDLVRPGGREQVGGLLGVEARHLEGVLELLTEGAGRADHQHRDDQP